MNIRQVILKAADHIEANPKLFDFGQVYTPDCGTPGCLLGWAAHFFGLKVGTSIGDFCDVLGLDSSDFYDRVSCIWREKQDWFLGPQWQKDAVECARCMRIYADRYHSEPLTITSELNRIFADARRVAA